jgi:hypothetical protein
MNASETIQHLLKEKSVLKQDVYHLTTDTFKELKKVLDVIVELINVLADALSKNAPPGYSAPDPGLLSAGLNVMSRIPQETPNISKIKSLRIFGE